MSVQYDPTRAKFVVRWREDGKQRGRRFSSESEARAFDAHVNPTSWVQRYEDRHRRDDASGAFPVPLIKMAKNLARPDRPD